MTSTRGENLETSTEEAPSPMPSAMTNGMKPIPALSAL
jgi:hypothetical protein